MNKDPRETNGEGDQSGGGDGGAAGGAGSLNMPRRPKQQPDLPSGFPPAGFAPGQGFTSSPPKKVEVRQTLFPEDLPLAYEAPEEEPPFLSQKGKWPRLSQDGLFALMMVFFILGIAVALLAGFVFAAPAAIALLVGLGIAIAPLIAIGAVRFFVAAGKAIYNASIVFFNAVKRFGKAMVELGRTLVKTGRTLVEMAISFARFCRNNFSALFGLAGLAVFAMAAFFLGPFLAPLVGVAAAPIIAFAIGVVALLMFFGLGAWLRGKFGLPMPFSEKVLLALAISVPIGIGLMLFAPGLALLIFPGLAAGTAAILMGALVCAAPFILWFLGSGLKSLLMKAAKNPLSAGMTIGILFVLSVGTLAVLSTLGIVAVSLPLIIALFGMGVACCLPYLFYSLFSGKPPWSERTTQQKILLLLAIGAIAAVGVFAIGMAAGLVLPGIAGLGSVLLLSGGALLAPLLLYGSFLAIQNAINYVIEFVRKNPRLIIGSIGVMMMVASLIVGLLFPPLAVGMLIMGVFGAVFAIGAAFNKIWEQAIRLGRWIRKNAVSIFAFLAIATIGVALVFFPVGVALAGFALPALLLLGMGFLIAKRPLSLLDKIILGLVGSVIVGLATAGLLLLFAPGLALLPLIGIAAAAGFLPLIAYGIYQTLKWVQKNSVYIFSFIALVGAGVTTALVMTGALVLPFALPLIFAGALAVLSIGLAIRLLSGEPLTKKEKAVITIASALLVGALALVLGGWALALILGPIALVGGAALSMREWIRENPFSAGSLYVSSMFLIGAAVSLLLAFSPVGAMVCFALAGVSVLAGIIDYLSGKLLSPTTAPEAAKTDKASQTDNLSDFMVEEILKHRAEASQKELTDRSEPPSYAEAIVPPSAPYEDGSPPSYDGPSVVPQQTLPPSYNQSMPDSREMDSKLGSDWEDLGSDEQRKEFWLDTPAPSLAGVTSVESELQIESPDGTKTKEEDWQVLGPDQLTVEQEIAAEIEGTETESQLGSASETEGWTNVDGYAAREGVQKEAQAAIGEKVKAEWVNVAGPDTIEKGMEEESDREWRKGFLLEADQIQRIREGEMQASETSFVVVPEFTRELKEQSEAKPGREATLTPSAPPAEPQPYQQFEPPRAYNPAYSPDVVVPPYCQDARDLSPYVAPQPSGTVSQLSPLPTSPGLCQCCGWSGGACKRQAQQREAEEALQRAQAAAAAQAALAQQQGGRGQAPSPQNIP
jgi:hypothetical protein